MPQPTSKPANSDINNSTASSDFADRIDFVHASPAFVEEQYQRYQADSAAVGGDWAAFFAGFELASTNGGGPAQAPEGKIGRDTGATDRGVYGLVNRYRNLGFRAAAIDPLGHHPDTHPLLGLTEFDLDDVAVTAHVGSGGFGGASDGTLGDLLQRLRETYSGPIAVELAAITNAEQRHWLLERMEPSYNRPRLDKADRLAVLNILIRGEGFERYLGTKYLGQKRFSIEGADTLLVMLDTLLEHGAQHGLQEFVFAMAHRGRLNVLANTLRKPLEIIFSEFEGTSHDAESPWRSDVKYHLGYSGNYTTRSGHRVYTALAYNPSHLELVDPVVEGSVQARQDHSGDTERKRSVPVVMHGEAAFTGQGIVPETLSLSELPGYHTGGTIHIIVNNQIGFTATPAETRFTHYPTDVAKMIEAPIIHVNADHPEAVVHAARLAVEFRQRFSVDVFINLVAYRRHGHNESDDPSFTQPLMYRQIAAHEPVAAQYARRLIAGGLITAAEIQGIEDRVRAELDEAQRVAIETRPAEPQLTLSGRWKDFSRVYKEAPTSTGVKQKVLQQIGTALTQVPDGFHLHRKLERLLQTRGAMARGDADVDWGMAELLAFGSLLLDGYPVRLTGEDSERGTFSHRHAVWYDTESAARHVALEALAAPARFEVRNTMLSELAVLGFEYGISTVDPQRLVLWEAQFGDFFNGAQPMIDQFIASAESKWLRMSGIVLLLPHGHEGQGPEHSSARPERFLQLCANDNMQVVYPTTAAQYFHVLRRQQHRDVRKPLIVLAPKSLLRAKVASSPIAELTEGNFQLAIDDRRTAGRTPRTVVVCSGKIYHELARAAADQGIDDVAMVRLEQFYPFPAAALRDIFAHFGDVTDVRWLQEEPENMGGWTFVRPRLSALLSAKSRLNYVGRSESASPATGSHAVHEREQADILARALARSTQSKQVKA
jgi:2-oxoglutarate dehydrogenase E1 component